ncbi:putative integral membrane protein [Acanthocheilonema viteae]
MGPSTKCECAIGVVVGDKVSGASLSLAFTSNAGFIPLLTQLGWVLFAPRGRFSYSSTTICSIFNPPIPLAAVTAAAVAVIAY